MRDAGNLIVTDLMSVSTNDGDDVVVVISRLGGFVELLALPRWVWRPSRDDDDDHRASGAENIAAAVDAPRRLLNLTDAIEITAFTTAQHHFDVMSLDAYICPPAGGEGGMAAKASPTTAEFVLATCGGGGRRSPAATAVERRNRLHSDDDKNAEVVTLWAVSISRGLTSKSPRDEGEDDFYLSPSRNVDLYDDRDRNDDSLFKLIVRRLDYHIIDNVGADSSVFLSDVAAERWTSSAATKEENGRNDGELPTSPTERGRKRRKRLNEKQDFAPCSTAVARAAVPVAMLRFSPPSSNSRSVGGGMKDDKVLLAALDYNGGVSVLDVTEQSNCNSDPAYNHDGDSKKIHLFCSRDSTMTLPSRSRKRSKSSYKGRMAMASSSQIEWWSSGEGGRDVHSSAGSAALERSLSCSFTLVTYATLITGQNKNNMLIHQKAKYMKTKAIMRMQRWSWSSGFAKDQDQCNPSDVFCMPMSTSDGIDSAVVLLPMPTMLRQQQQSRHSSSSCHKMLSFLRLSADIVADIAEENHSKTAASKPSSSFDLTPPPQCRLHLSICGIKKFSKPAEIIATLLRRGYASKAIGVARRFGIGDDGGQRQNHILGEEGRLMMNRCRIQLWEERLDVKALKHVSDDAYVIRQALELLQCQDNFRIHHNCDLSLNKLLEIFSEAVARCDALREERMTSSARQLRDAVRRIGTFKLLLNHYADKTTASDARATKGISPNEQCLFARRFLSDFKDESLYDIAICAASKGDIYALTVLIVRHPFTMSERMQILDHAPLDVDITLYDHLLPCHIDGDNHGGKKVAHIFFPGKKYHHLGNEMFLSPLQLFTYLSNLQLQRRQLGAEREIPEIDIFTDDADRESVMLHFEKGVDDESLSSSLSSTSKVDVATWYLNRVLCTHNLTGQVLPFKELCLAGLIRLGIVSFTEGGAINTSDFNDFSDSSPESQVVGKLIYLYSAASFFCQILADKLCWVLRTWYVDEDQDCQQSSSLNETFDELKVGSGFFLSVVQFCTMDLNDAIPYIIENGNMHSISMFQKYFAPFVDGSGKYLEPRKNIEAAVCYFGSENMSDRFKHDMIELCLNKITRLKKSKNIPAMQPSLPIRLEESLSLCADFALLCFGYNSKSRIAQKEDFLINFLESIFNSTLDVIKMEWGALTDGVIDKLWSIFELLPCTITHELDEPPSNSTIQKGTIGGFHFRLVALQLCCKWHACQTFPSELLNLFYTGPYKGEGEFDNRGIRDLCRAGRGVILIICRAFCERAAKPASQKNSENFPHQDEKYHDAEDNITSGALSNEGHDLIFDFITDVDEFDSRFFTSGAQQSGCIGSFVFSSLLYQHCFVMLKNILKIRPSWFCQNYISSTIATFMRDAATSNNKNTNTTLAYHEILEQMFPHLCVEFEHHQRVIAAKEFIAVAMALDDNLLEKLFAILDNAAQPIDLVRALIDIDASAILLGCEFWGDKRSALAACTDASVWLSSQIRALMSGRTAEESSRVLPQMPGALVIQLANIIGLYAPHEILLVKCFMTHGVLRMNLGPAAVAICYSMLYDAAVSRRENIPDSRRTSHQELQVLNCVIAVAKAQSFFDLSIKGDLLTLTLQLIPIADSPLACVLLGTFKELEYDLLALTMNSLNDDAAQLSEKADDFLVFKAAKRAARGARDLVENTNKNSDITMKRNNFHDRSMIRVFRDIKKSSQADLLEKLFLMGDQTANDDSRSLAKSISESIFNWVIAEVFLARKSSIPLSLPAANILMMMELGLSCLLEFQGQDMSLIVKRALQDFKSKSVLPIAQTSAIPEPTAQPDISIIQRLRDRGYGQNAARRAVIMTDNQGYSAALTWAVSHFSDADFDSPIYFLCSDTTHVDQGVVNMADKLLQSIQNRVKGNWSQTNTSKHDRTSVACTRPKKPLDKPHGSSILLKKIIASKNPCQAPFPSPFLSDRLVDRSSSFNAAPASGAAEHTHVTTLSKTSFVQSPSTTRKKNFLSEKSCQSPFESPLTSSDRDQLPDHTSTPNAAQAYVATKQTYATKQTETPFVSKIPSPSTTKACLPHIAMDNYSTRTSDKETLTINSPQRPSPRNLPDSASSVEGSLSSRASVKDQIKLGRVRFETQKLSLNERKKLALEGRRLLNAARAQRKDIFEPPTTITTSSPRPPI